MFIPRMLASMISPGGKGAALSILIFHRVLPVRDPLFPDEMDAARFDELLGWIGKCFTVLRLEAAVEMQMQGTLPPRAVAITFDDGYADNYTVALPILKKHGMSASFFIAAGFLDGGRMFNDTIINVVRQFDGNELDLRALGLGRFETRTITQRRKAIDALLPAFKYLPLEERAHRISILQEQVDLPLPDDLMMTTEQVRELRSEGMTIGGHTCTHPILSQLDDESAFHEIGAGKEALERILAEPISVFAYPNGVPGRDFLPQHVAMVRELGFSAAFTTSAGVARHGSDIYQLPRFTPWDRTPLRFGLRMVNNLRSLGKVVA